MQRVSSFRAQAKLIFRLIFAFIITTSWAGAAPQEELRSRLEEFEKRLQELEKKVAGSQDDEVAELQRRIEVLATELEQLRSGEKELVVTPEQAQAYGVGPSAASVYRKPQGVSIAGYGEMLYENFNNRNESGTRTFQPSRFDFLRAVLYTGYRFNEKFLFNSEIEFEHASTGRGGEASVEFAYVDYLAAPYLTLRGGLVLIPMGLTNEFHEPTAFLGAKRSETESRIIPTTWRENGFGVLGSAGKFQYRAYLVNGLTAAGFSSDGLRGGRQKGATSLATDMAFVGRLDVMPTPGVFFGGSLYSGESDQGQFSDRGRQLEVNTTIGELHGQVQAHGFDLRGLFARAVLDDVSGLNSARQLTGKASIGETLEGGYLQIGYNALTRFSETVRLTPYYRFEKLNTQDEVPSGFLPDPARNRTFHTFGLEFRPIRPVVIKGDYQWLKNRADSGLNQLNILLGYAF
ncbi:MAG: hypothetical protein HY645_00160 [Acidobacteria bacterium]|nr:hypothetical protein [Acidobacteriota bacterium]